MKTLVALATTAAALALATPASAVLLQFNVSGFDDFGNSESASLQLDSHPTVDYGLSGVGFIIGNVAGNFEYAGVTSNLEDLIFYNENFGGGYFTGDYLNTFIGPQLYTGDETSPTFLTGTFQLTDALVGGSFTLTISEVNAPPGSVPEPAAWAMMIAGFGMVGGALRSCRSTTVSFA